jgi:hypothetical protein
MSGAGSAYAAEITALQAYQKHILNTLDGLMVANAALTAVEAVSSAVGGAGANNGLGTFEEAAQLSNTYNSVMQTMMTNFKEITELVSAMANALGKSAQNYLETEQRITDSFNDIVKKYEAQSGGFSTPGTSTSTAPTSVSGYTGTSNAYNSATTASGTATGTGAGTTTAAQTQTQTQTSTITTTSSGSGSISRANTANTSNDTNSELQ